MSVPTPSSASEPCQGSARPNGRPSLYEDIQGRGCVTKLGKVDVVYDAIGGDQFERAFRTLGYGGRHLVVGFAAGSIPKLPLNLALMKSALVIGANLLNAYEVEPERCAANGRYLLELLAQGKLPEPVVAKRYPLEQAAEAYAEVAAGQAAGRVLIMVGGTGA